MEVTWAYFPLHPETPAEGQPLTELFKGREERLQSFQEHMKQLMAEAELPWSERSMTYNSRLAQELAAWADTRRGGEALHNLLYRAYFVDNLNIADKSTLVSLSNQAGLDTTEAEQVLNERAFSDTVDRDWQRAAQLGITGVPTFVSNDLCVVGCQPYEILMRFVNHLRGITS